MTTDDGTVTPNPEFTGAEGVRLSARLGGISLAHFGRFFAHQFTHLVHADQQGISPV